MERHLSHTGYVYRRAERALLRGALFVSVLLFAAMAALPLSAQQSDSGQRIDPKQTEKRIDAYRANQKRIDARGIPRLSAAPARQDRDTGPVFVLRGIAIDGASVFADDAFRAAYQPYIGNKVSQADLAKIAEEISKVYRDADFHLSRAIIPPQDIKGGHIRIQIVEGAIEEIVLKGDGVEGYGVRAVLVPVTGEHPARLATLERGLLLAHDVPGVNVTDTELEEIGTASGRFRLIVHLETWAIYTALGLDNRGTSDVGPLQGYFVSAFNSVLRPADIVGVDLSTIPDAHEELGFGRFSYETPVGFNGTRLGVAASYNAIRPSDVRRRELDTVTRTKSLEVEVTRALRRTRKSSFWATATLGVSDISESDGLGTTYSDAIRTLSLTGSYELHDNYKGVNHLTATVTNGADIFGASDRNDILLSTGDGDPEFTKLDFFFTRYQKLSDTWSLNLAAGGQWASTALLSSEEFYIGGPVFGRGYDGGELSGDQALAGSLELRYDKEFKQGRLKGYQLYAFADRAGVRNFSDGEDDVDTLSSAGGGLRLYLARDLQAGVELALPLDYRSPENLDRDPRVFFSLTKSFKLCPRRRPMRCNASAP